MTAVHVTGDGEAYAVHDPDLWPNLLPDDAVTLIDRARRAAGLTCDQLAERAGISPRAVKTALSGHRNPSLEQLRRMCTALGIVLPAEYAWIGQ